jgi:trans-aconitate methyltransferase
MSSNTLNWNAIYSNGLPGSFLRYPDNNFVSLFFQNRSHIKINGSCLDYGFGSANNSEFLIQNMGELYGIEASEASIEVAHKRLINFRGFNQLNYVSKWDLSNWKNKFDLVLAWQALYYNDEEGVRDTIERFYSILANNGVLIVTLITQRDTKAIFATKVAPNTFKIDERIPSQNGCVVYAVDCIDNFLKFFDKFNILDFGLFERASLSSGNMLSEYYLVVKK